MCGLAGFLDSSGARHRDTLIADVEAMAAAVRHRGPDDAGAWVDETAGVALAFRRLSIIDLSQAGHQPQLSRSGRLVLVFNGEIYNHLDLRAELTATAGPQPWVGHSDTETLLAGFEVWGVRATLERTVGMFALALWDRETRQLSLARDRFGEKPLYYGWSRNGFVFGSELKALQRSPGFDNPIDRDVVSLYMQYACVPAPYSIYQGVYKLEPGCVLSLPLSRAATPPARAPFADDPDSGLALNRYWSIADVATRGLANPIEDEHEAVDRLEAVLSDAVRLQSIADVPLGAFLSGGIDSSTIVALMQAQSSQKVRTFTIGFEEAGFNEAAHAKAVARHLGTDHTELYVSAQHARDVIPRLPDLYSEPFADSSQIPTYLVSQMARRHVTVALSGDGGDELLGGYTRYVWGPRVWSGLRWASAGLRRGLSAAITGVPVRRWDALGVLIPGRPLGAVGDKVHKLAHRLNWINSVDGLYRRVVTTWPADSGVVLGALPLRSTLDGLAAGHSNAGSAHGMMLRDSMTYLPDDILHKVDRASMGVGLETRAPFLDHRVAELAWRLPLRFKIRGGQGKWVLRRVLDRHVPRELIERPKMGFGMPVGAWIRGPLRDWAESLLNEQTLRSGGYLDPAPIGQKWREHLAGTRAWHNELWPVLMFQAWLKAQR